MKQISSRKAALMVIASAVLWGTYGAFVTVITDLGIGRNAQIFLRFLMTFLPVGVLMRLMEPASFRIRRKDFWLFPANGVCSLVFFSACYTAAIRLTKIATAAALLYTAPVIVMVLSVLLFGEKLSRRKIFCVLMSVVGCAFASGIGSDLIGAGGAGRLSAAGILTGLGAGLGYALYSIFSRAILNRGYAVFTNIFYSFIAADAIFLILSLMDGSFFDLAEHPGAAVLGLVCGAVTGFGSYVLYTFGMEKMETSRAAQLATIEPVTAAVIGALLFRQPISGFEVLGIALVVGSVILMNTK